MGPPLPLLVRIVALTFALEASVFARGGAATASFVPARRGSNAGGAVVARPPSPKVSPSSLGAGRSEVLAEDEGAVDHPRSRSRLVWLTGHGDLRLRDHGGFSDAVRAASAAPDERVVPVFVVDPEAHLQSRPEPFLRRLRACLSSLSADLDALSCSRPSLSPLVVRTGSAPAVLAGLARETNAVACHVIDDDVVPRARAAQREAVAALVGSGVEVRRWTNCLRPSAPWAVTRGKQGLLPSFFPEYCKIADSLPTAAPMEVDWDALVEREGSAARRKTTLKIPSEGIPSLEEILAAASSTMPASVAEILTSRSNYCVTTEPYEHVMTKAWCTERGARAGLEEYCSIGRDAFADKYFKSENVMISSCPESKSMYSQAAARLLRQVDQPSKVLALRETATRAFSSALNLGALSPRDVADAAKNGSNRRAKLFPSDDQLWGRSSEGSLHDVVEWREWFLLLAERSLYLQERDEPATSGGERMRDTDGIAGGGDPREEGTVNFWRWKGQHLVRYLTWPQGEDYEEQHKKSRIPAILLVHGFAASAEQWARLVYSLRDQSMSEHGKDFTPPIYAVDLLGFGHSEKPGLSYTQYLWESQLIDFAIEVMEARPMIMVGNSIGGGISAGAAASLGSDVVRGLVLCNTAGVLEDPDSYRGYVARDTGLNGSITTYTEAALEGNPGEDPYRPVPLIGNKALDAFGKGIVELIYPQIEDRLAMIYGNRMENADAAVVYAIQQGAASPGSANVIGSGQKLAPNRPLNEVLVGTGEDQGFPVLVVMGLDDRVSSPQVAQKRAELFSRLSPGRIIVEAIEDAGHCPHDDQPDKVARAMRGWLRNCSIADNASD